MNLKQYIEERYPIKDKLEHLKKNPYARVRDADFLPYDDIIVVDGILQKVVKLKDDEYITVMDLISYTKEDIDKMSECVLKTAWTTYMENVEITDVTEKEFDALQRLSRQYSEHVALREEQLYKCTH